MVKTKVTRISRQTSTTDVITDKKKKKEEMEIFLLLGSHVSNGTRYTREIKGDLQWQKQYSTKKNPFTSKHWT